MSDNNSISPPPVPKDHIALDAIESVISTLQEEQANNATRKRAIVITHLETALLWQKDSMGLWVDSPHPVYLLQE